MLVLSVLLILMTKLLMIEVMVMVLLVTTVNGDHCSG